MKNVLYIIIFALLFLSGCSKPVVEDEISDISLPKGIGPERFTCQDIVGREVIYNDISTPEKLAESVEETWIEVYGKKITRQRPFIIGFDKDKQLWYVQGNTAYLGDGVGGVAYAIVDNNTGELLYIWHDE